MESKIEKKKEEAKLLEKEIRFVVTRGEKWEERELGESGQKVMSSYKISEH